MTQHEAFDRKKRSEDQLVSEGVPININLPFVEDTESAQIRSAEEIAWRAMALNLVSVKGEGLDQGRVLEIIDEYELDTAFSPLEKEFIYDTMPSQHDRVQFCWRYEAYWVMLWSLGFVESLGRPDHICDVATAVKVMVDRTSEEFIRDSRLRNVDEILNETDLIYRYHWACRDSYLVGNQAPAGLNSSVVLERHYALNWLVGYMDSCDWDDVSTDT